MLPTPPPPRGLPEPLSLEPESRPQGLGFSGARHMGSGLESPGSSPPWVLCPSGPDDLVFHLQELQGALQLHQACGAKPGLLLAKRGGGQVLPRHPPALLQKLPRLRQGLAGPTQQRPLPLHRGPHPGDPACDGAGGLEEQAPGGHCVGLGLCGGVEGGLPDHRSCRAGGGVCTEAQPDQGFWSPNGRADPPNPLFYQEELTPGCQPEWSSIGIGLGRAAQRPGGSERSCWSCWGHSELSPNNPHLTRFLPAARLWRHICD